MLFWLFLFPFICVYHFYYYSFYSLSLSQLHLLNCNNKYKIQIQPFGHFFISYRWSFLPLDQTIDYTCFNNHNIDSTGGLLKKKTLNISCMQTYLNTSNANSLLPIMIVKEKNVIIATNTQDLSSSDCTIKYNFTCILDIKTVTIYLLYLIPCDIVTQIQLVTLSSCHSK